VRLQAGAAALETTDVPVEELSSVLFGALGSGARSVAFEMRAAAELAIGTRGAAVSALTAALRPQLCASRVCELTTLDERDSDEADGDELGSGDDELGGEEGSGSQGDSARVRRLSGGEAPLAVTRYRVEYTLEATDSITAPEIDTAALAAALGVDASDVELAEPPSLQGLTVLASADASESLTSAAAASSLHLALTTALAAPLGSVSVVDVAALFPPSPPLPIRPQLSPEDPPPPPPPQGPPPPPPPPPRGRLTLYLMY